MKEIANLGRKKEKRHWFQFCKNFSHMLQPEITEANKRTVNLLSSSTLSFHYFFKHQGQDMLKHFLKNN